MNEPDKSLAVRNEISAVTAAIEVYLGTRQLIPEYDARATAAITAAQGFTKPPTTDTEQESILEAQRALSKLRKEAEKAGSAYRAPLNAGAKAIIAIENAAEAVLTREEKRLQGFVNFRQNKLLQERQEAEAAQARENRRIENERLAAELAEQAAQIARQQAQEAARIAEEAKRRNKAKAEAEALRLAQEAQKAEDEAFAKQLEAEAAPQPVAMPTSYLPQARMIRDFTLNGRSDSEKGESLRKFHAAHPAFFATHIKEGDGREYTIKLRIKDVTDALNGVAPFAKLESAPGITVNERLSTLR